MTLRGTTIDPPLRVTVLPCLGYRSYCESKPNMGSSMPWLALGKNGPLQAFDEDHDGFKTHCTECMWWFYFPELPIS